MLGFATWGVVSVSAGNGPPSTPRSLGVTPTTTAAKATAQLPAHVSTAPTNGETILSTGPTVAVQTTSGYLASVVVEAYPSGARLRGGLNAERDVWMATGGLRPNTTYHMMYKVEGGNGVTAMGTGTFSTGPVPVIQISTGVASPGSAPVGLRRHPVRQAQSRRVWRTVPQSLVRRPRVRRPRVRGARVP